MKRMPLWTFLLLFLGVAPIAHAQVTVLLEEPYSYDGAFAGTGHTAVYLSRICATSPTALRRCKPGETGVVISRYNRIAGRDWIAIPLIPYLYAVNNPEDIPLYADAKLVAFLRDQYRREHLEEIAPDTPSGEAPRGDWIQLIGSSYDRTSYGFEIETTPEEDDQLISQFNSRPNSASYKVVSRNCADFVRDVVNFYYPKAVSRGLLADLKVSTPKHAAKSFVKYSQQHKDLEFSSSVIPQVPGTIKRSKPIRGIMESVFKAKKYVIPLAFLHPVLTGGVAAAYLLGSRFNPAKNAMVFNPDGNLELPLTTEERRAYQKNLQELVQRTPDEKSDPERASWQQFQERSQLHLDQSGHVILQAQLGDSRVELGISRSNLLSGEAPTELQRDLLITRLRAELTSGRAPRTSGREVRDDWQLLQNVVSSQHERENVASRSVLANQ